MMKKKYLTPLTAIITLPHCSYLLDTSNEVEKQISGTEVDSGW